MIYYIGNESLQDVAWRWEGRSFFLNQREFEEMMAVKSMEGE